METTHKERMYRAAAAYAKAGWAVFPLGQMSKKPAIKKGFLGASANEFQISAWWQAKSYAGANIGYAVPDGLLILDVDVREEKDGEAAFHKLQTELGPLPATRQVTTASGGWHFYFHVPAGFLHKKELVPGCIDLKGPGGYVLLPPSALVLPRADGGKAKAEYTWDGLKGWEEPIAELPERWLAACRRPEPASGPAKGGKESEGPPAALGPIENGCGWLAHCKADAAALGEPEWYAMLGVLGRCETGETLAHEWSKPHKGYSAAATKAKLAHALNDAGPVTCERVKSEFSGGRYCEHCAHWGKITSPIVLGVRGPAAEPWAEGLLLNQKGRIIGCFANTLHALSEHPDWKAKLVYNQFSEAVEFLNESPAGGGPLNDTRQLATVAWLQRTVASTINEHMTRSALELAARRGPYHPLKRELELARAVWDQRPRLREGFFQKYFGVTTSEAMREGKREDHELYLDHAAVFFVLGLVARVYLPGARIEHALVLEGGEAAAKSRALQLLARWPYHAVLHPKIESGAAVEHLRGVWLIEVPEPGLYEPGLLREFLFRTKDKVHTEFWRPSYGRLWEERPRQCGFALTGECSDDLLGWRAMPIECGRVDLGALGRDAEQVRAEAVWMLREQQAKWYPGREIWPLFQREQRGRRVQDPLTLRIERYLETHGHVSVLEMFDAFNIPTGQQTTALGRRAARILAAHGYHLLDEPGGPYWVDPGKPSTVAATLQ